MGRTRSGWLYLEAVLDLHSLLSSTQNSPPQGVNSGWKSTTYPSVGQMRCNLVNFGHHIRRELGNYVYGSQIVAQLVNL